MLLYTRSRVSECFAIILLLVKLIPDRIVLYLFPVSGVSLMNRVRVQISSSASEKSHVTWLHIVFVLYIERVCETGKLPLWLKYPKLFTRANCNLFFKKSYFAKK